MKAETLFRLMAQMDSHFIGRMSGLHSSLAEKLREGQ